MIINTWRAGTFQECRRKARFVHLENLSPLRTPDTLVTGDAVHKGLATLFVTSDTSLAIQKARSTYRERYAGELQLPEEVKLHERNVAFAERAVAEYANAYPKQRFTVLHPEVSFLVELPGTRHHCAFAHHLLYDEWLRPDDERQCHPATSPQCWQSHWFGGRTDAIISWEGKLWLLEHKTTGLTTTNQKGEMEAQQNYKDTFHLDFQPTGYLYGISRQLGLRLNGFILNCILKPRKNASDQFAVHLDQDIFIRTEEQLADYERELIQLCDDYERAVVEQHMYKNTRSCMKFNRKCAYWNLCKALREPQQGEFSQRQPDYIDLEYYKLLQLDPPKEVSQCLSADPVEANL